MLLHVLGIIGLVADLKGGTPNVKVVSFRFKYIIIASLILRRILFKMILLLGLEVGLILPDCEMSSSQVIFGLLRNAISRELLLSVKHVVSGIKVVFSIP